MAGELGFVLLGYGGVRFGAAGMVSCGRVGLVLFGSGRCGSLGFGLLMLVGVSHGASRPGKAGKVCCVKLY